MTDLFCKMKEHYGDAIIAPYIAKLQPASLKALELLLNEVKQKDDTNHMVDEHLPKQDITKSIEELMQKMTDDKWALRKKALDDAGTLLK
jgi:hypothetical protein